MTPEARIAYQFRAAFHKEPQLFIAPARINLIGEHVDYNNGIVMPAAIDKHFVFAVAPSGNDKCNIYADDLQEGVSFTIRDMHPGEEWLNYLMGVLDAFDRRGMLKGGVDCVFGSNIPAGAGMSSSAALCCGFGFAFNEIYKLNLDRKTIAKMAQYAEREFAGANVGIMDQYASLFGEKDSALLLDCRSLTHEVLPFDFPFYSIVLVDTKVKHTLAGSGYNERRETCEEGVRIIRKSHPEILSLRDVTAPILLEQRDKLGEDIFVKCLFIVEEIARAQTAGALLKEKNITGFGSLMFQAHWGLSQAYEVSCAELDHLVMLAEEDKQMVAGSRMMGGGFGGCTINLVSKDQKEKFIDKTRKNYFATFKKEPDFYSVTLSQGVHQIHS
jgi:galactokinase